MPGSSNSEKKGPNTEIIVRDRRQPRQFSIHNRVMDEWAPIITTYGLTLYMFYTRLSNQKDERAYPGYSLIQEHFSMGSSTISNYNKLLEWCELLFINPGDYYSPNEYYILEIPKVTPERLAAIRAKAIEHFKPNSTFLKALLKRLDEWKPIQERWNKGGRGGVVVRKAENGQLPLDLGGQEGTSPGEGTRKAADADEKDASTAERPVQPAGAGKGGTPPGEHLVQPADSGEGGTPPGEEGTPPGEGGTPRGEEGTPPEKEGTFPGEGGAPLGEEGTPQGKVEQSETTIRTDNPNKQSETTTTVPKSEGGSGDEGDAVAAVSDEQALQALLSIDFQPASMAGRYVKKYDNKTILAWVAVTRWPESDWMDNPAGYVRKRLDAGDQPPPRPADDPDHIEPVSEAEVEAYRPTPARVACPGCGQAAEPCPTCDQCSTCCVCETAVDGTGLTVRDAWQSALGELKLQMSRGTFSWLRPTRVVAYEPGVFVIGVENVYAQDWLDNRLRSKVERTLAGVAGAETEVQFVVTTAQDGQ